MSELKGNTEECSCPENICVSNEHRQKGTSDPDNSKNHKFDARNYFESQKYAIQGIRLIIRNERNFRIQLVAAIGSVVAGFLFHISHQEWVALFVVIALVLVAESFNSVVEAICDTITRDYRINVKYAKDVSAGAVFVSACVSLVAGVIIFSPYVWNLLVSVVKMV